MKTSLKVTTEILRAMKAENTTPISAALTDSDSAGCQEEESDENFVPKKCITEARNDDYFDSDKLQAHQARPNLLEGLPDCPSSCDEDHDPPPLNDDPDAAIIWSNPAFCCGHDTSDGSESCTSKRSSIGSKCSTDWYRENAGSGSVYRRRNAAQQIHDDFNSTVSISTTPVVNISVNVSLGGAEEHRTKYRANRICSKRAHRGSARPEKTPKPFSRNVMSETGRDRAVRNAGGAIFAITEEEAKIRSELAREIEKGLEVEIRQQISNLNRRLEELRAHKKSEILHQTYNQRSVLKGLKDEIKINADYSEKKFDWVKTLRTSSLNSAETDNSNNADCFMVRRRRLPVFFSESATDRSFDRERVIPERSKSEPRRRRAPSKSSHDCNPCRSKDDIAVDVSQMKFSSSRGRSGLSKIKGNFNHFEQVDKLKSNRSAAVKPVEVEEKFLFVDMVKGTDQVSDGKRLGQNVPKRVRFPAAKLLHVNNHG